MPTNFSDIAFFYLNSHLSKKPPVQRIMCLYTSMLLNLASSFQIPNYNLQMTWLYSPVKPMLAYGNLLEMRHIFKVLPRFWNTLQQKANSHIGLGCSWFEYTICLVSYLWRTSSRCLHFITRWNAGAPAVALEHYRLLNLKQVQSDTLSHLVLSRAATFSNSTLGDLTYLSECMESSQIYMTNSQEVLLWPTSYLLSPWLICNATYVRQPSSLPAPFNWKSILKSVSTLFFRYEQSLCWHTIFLSGRWFHPLWRPTGQFLTTRPYEDWTRSHATCARANQRGFSWHGTDWTEVHLWPLYVPPFVSLLLRKVTPRVSSASRQQRLWHHP